MWRGCWVVKSVITVLKQIVFHMGVLKSERVWVKYIKNEQNIIYLMQKWWKLLKGGPNKSEQRLKMKTCCTKWCKRECLTNALLVGTVNLHSCVAVFVTNCSNLKISPMTCCSKKLLCMKFSLFHQKLLCLHSRGPQSMGQGPLGGQNFENVKYKAS